MRVAASRFVERNSRKDPKIRPLRRPPTGGRDRLCRPLPPSVNLERYIENIQNEGRSAHAAIINYKYLDGPALDIFVGKRTSDIGVSYKMKTALHYGALSCNPFVISKLVVNNANPTSRDEDGRTPLHYILDYCDVRVIETLKLKFEIGEPFCDVPSYVMKLVNELYNRNISIDNIIASAKILIKCSMLWDAVMYKNWCKKRKVTLLPELLNYLKSCISEHNSRSKSNKGGQKPGRGRILTDTPENEEIKNIVLLKLPKERKRKLVKKPEFEIKATSSKEISDFEDSHSTDDANSTVSDADWNLGKHNIVSRTLLESPKVLLQGCGIDSKKQEMLDVDQGHVGHAPLHQLMAGIYGHQPYSPSKQSRECYAAAKTVALGNRTKGVQPNSTQSAS
ncbi:hypothetical protein TNCV_2697021 [Trichonephila clavipes]|nr:hypothetical protein TNCV_2697021 [Trichonephila clavipes]